jgi:hypothetical protein
MSRAVEEPLITAQQIMLLRSYVKLLFSPRAQQFKWRAVQSARPRGATSPPSLRRDHFTIASDGAALMHEK